MTQKTLDKNVKTLYDSDVALLIDKTREVDGIEWYGHRPVDENTQKIMLASARSAAIGTLAAVWGVPEEYIPRNLKDDLFTPESGLTKHPVLTTVATGPGCLAYQMLYPRNATGLQIVQSEFENAVGVLEGRHAIAIERKHVRYGHFYEANCLMTSDKCKPELQERIKMLEHVFNEV